MAAPPGVSQPGTNSAPALRVRPSDAISASGSSVDPLNVCERAGVAMEQASGLPPGLLLAIGRVESGRWDGQRGRVAAWPWTINAAGKGMWFESKEAAAQAVRDLLNGGTRSVDVGCFQINLLWHPTAFASLEQAFDPDANAAYAAHFLLALFSQTGSWDTAVEDYHSADPALGFAYRQQVFSTWDTAAGMTNLAPSRGRATPVLAIASRPIAIPTVIAGVQIWTPMPFGTASGVVAMPGSTALQQSHVANGAPMPLPVVLYQAMPPGLLAARVTRNKPRSARDVSTELNPPR